MTRYVALVLLASLAGCMLFPTSEAVCRTSDWKQRGYDDGYFGHLPQDMRLAQDCARFGVQIAEAAYLEGWRAGYDEWDRLMGSMFNKGR